MRSIIYDQNIILSKFRVVLVYYWPKSTPNVVAINHTYRPKSTPNVVAGEIYVTKDLGFQQVPTSFNLNREASGCQSSRPTYVRTCTLPKIYDRTIDDTPGEERLVRRWAVLS